MSATKVMFRNSLSKCFFSRNLGLRTFLSEAYSCEEAWQRRLTKPPLNQLKMSQYFIELDKKFQTKRLASGVDIDMFANNVQENSQLDELEHLLYRFRRTKRAWEMMESTHYAVVRAFLKLQDYESLFRILSDRENYGVFPDLYTYNWLMDTFLKQERYRDAAEIATLMMLQEDFSNPISRALALHSCYQFLDKCAVESFWDRGYATEENVEDKNEANEDDDEEETLVRVPYLRNPWFDDHFDIKDPKQLIGKTLYLNGRHEDNVLGRTSQILGLGMYGKWDKAVNVLESLLKVTSSHVLLQEGVSKFMETLRALPEDDENKSKFLDMFESKFLSLQQENKISDVSITTECQKELERIKTLENEDIARQHKLYIEWEQMRQAALSEQEKDIDKENRLKIIAEKKEELYWKEKLLFFFENEDLIKDELEKVNKLLEDQKTKTFVEDAYVPPEIIKKKPLRMSKLRRKAMVKAL